MKESRTVLLTGGTGQVGIHVLDGLMAAAFHCLAPSRQLQSSIRKSRTEGSVCWFNPAALSRRPGDEETDFSSVELLISTGPVELAIKYLGCCPKLRRVVCLSTSSVLSKADSEDLKERELVGRIATAEQQLQASCADRQLELAILRPTLIYGCGMDANISLLAQFVQRFGFMPLAGPASGLRQPIHVADLAVVLVMLATTGQSPNLVSPAVGGSTISYREMVVRIFEALGRKPRIISLPPGLLQAGISIISGLAKRGGLNRAMVARQNQDLVFDDSELRRQFQFSPRGFRPGPADFTLPRELQTLLPF